MFLGDDILDAESEVAQATLGKVLLADIQHGIVKRPAHQELQTQVVDPLAVRESLALLGPIPLQNEAIAESKTGGRVRSGFVAVEHAPGEGGLDVADDFGLKAIFVFEALDLMLGPGLTLWLRNGSYKEPGISVLCRLKGVCP